MTEGNGSNLPIPDPTKLTTDAITLVTDQYRRELVQLQELIELRIGMIDRLLTERYNTQVKALDAAFVTAEKAINKAESANEIRFQSVNEFRQTLIDQAATFLTIDVYNTSQKALEEKITANSQRIAEIDSRLTSRLDLSAGDLAGIRTRKEDERASEGLNQATVNNRLILLGVGISIVVIVVNIVIALVIHH